MRRTLATVAAAASMLLVGAASAQASDDPVPVADPPAAFSLPAPGPVVDEASAENFARRLAARRAARFLGVDNSRRVRVFDVNARCLEHPAVADRFGCVFTLRAAVIQRSRGWDGYPGGHGHDNATAASSSKGSKSRNRRVRIRNYGCLGLLRIQGGPTVTPSVEVRLAECARVPRGDYDAPEPAPVQ